MFNARPVSTSSAVGVALAMARPFFSYASIESSASARKGTPRSAYTFYLADVRNLVECDCGRLTVQVSHLHSAVRSFVKNPGSPCGRSCCGWGRVHACLASLPGSEFSDAAGGFD